jgi:DNA-binding transcriptional ArsR family regulator
MEDIYYFSSLEQIRVLRVPTRWEILNLLVKQPMTSAQLARALGITRSLAHYHLKVLESVDLVVFLEERYLNGVVEKYYRALGRQYRSDHLVDQYRAGNGKNDAGVQTGEAVGELMKMMLEIAGADISRPEASQLLAKIGFNFQDEVCLTSEQTCEFIEKLRRLADDYIALDRRNQQDDVNQEALTHIRFTWLITPISGPRYHTHLPNNGEAASLKTDESENLTSTGSQE